MPNKLDLHLIKSIVPQNNMSHPSSLSGYPHHWGCQHLDGHPDDKGECQVKDGSFRFPDGSIARRKEIQSGQVFMVAHSLQKPPEIHKVI